MTATSYATSTHPAAPSTAGDRARILELLGGRRGIVDGALPPLMFVAVNAVAGTQLPRPEALSYAIGGAVSVGLGIVGIRMLRREPLRQALGGLIGLAIAVAFALGSGEARSFFLPGIYVDAAYAAILAGSVAVGRPLIGALWGSSSGRAVSGGATRACAGGSPSRRSVGPWSTPPAPSPRPRSTSTTAQASWP
jgi:hypothetical protein